MTATESSSVGSRESARDWLVRIRAEYFEFPGLHLTRQQAQRLWNMEPGLCDAVLQTLIDEHFLRVAPNGTYARVDADY
jgi:hypothetical protein